MISQSVTRIALNKKMSLLLLHIRGQRKENLTTKIINLKEQIFFTVQLVTYVTKQKLVTKVL